MKRTIHNFKESESVRFNAALGVSTQNYAVRITRYTLEVSGSDYIEWGRLIIDAPRQFVADTVNGVAWGGDLDPLCTVTRLRSNNRLLIGQEADELDQAFSYGTPGRLFHPQSIWNPRLNLEAKPGSKIIVDLMHDDDTTLGTKCLPRLCIVVEED